MDRPDTSPQLLANTLRQFSIVNRFFSPHRSLLSRYIIADMLKEPRRCWRLMDAGAGGCDIDLWLLKVCRAKGLRLDIKCIDHDPRVVEYARCKTGHVPNIKIACADAMEIDKSGESFDYVLANHVLHHLAAADIGVFLQKADAVCQRVLLISDLLRSYFSYLIFAALARAFLRHSFAYTDGRISITKGFTRPELLEVVRNTRLKGSTVVDTAFPGHVYIVRRYEPINPQDNHRGTRLKSKGARLQQEPITV
ncbi:MAG TPA: methyltransferase domain-containing protein [Sedimentisphaerales bacterium]|nr:methyltransferase domain-containing protein [Sedimentisphaerales bacterium]